MEATIRVFIGSVFITPEPLSKQWRTAGKHIEANVELILLAWRNVVGFRPTDKFDLFC